MGTDKRKSGGLHNCRHRRQSSRSQSSLRMEGSMGARRGWSYPASEYELLYFVSEFPYLHSRYNLNNYSLGSSEDINI